MSFITRLGGRLPDFEDVMKRFPVTVVIMAAFTVWIIANNHFNLTSSRDDMYVASGFVLAGYMSLIAKLIIERRDGSAALGAIFSLVLAVPAFLICYFAKTLDFMVVMAIGAAILFLGNAAAWRAGRQDRNVWNLTQKLWTGALFAAVGSVIFLLGMLAISEAVRALFGLNLNDLTLETILPIGLAFLAPIYWLGTLPRYGEAEDVTELSFEARALSFLGTWMLAPLVIIYALIVLAYGLKILLQWDLPKGEIAQLVSPFIGVGMLVWLMLEPKVLKESGFVRFYRAAWHWIMLPAAVLLGLAVLARIGEYGFTPERVFLSLVVIWAIVQSLWFIILPKAKRDIRIPTALAAGLLAFGAFAVEPISVMSQYSRAHDVKLSLPVFDAASLRENPKQAKQFLGGLNYLIQEKDETRFKRLLPDRDMPENAYGPDYKSLLVDLGLDKAENNTPNRRSNYSIASQRPIEINSGSKVYWASSVSLFNSRKYGLSSGIVTSQNGREVVLSIEDETFQVNFSHILKDLKLVGQNNDTIDIIVPSMPIQSDNGVSATLYILDGYLSYQRDDLIGGDLSFVVILPN